ncbi:SH3 domain-containing protein [Roseovarius salinarum]|uniref:SH3 domain-containing protein n=1 Tax=Roseovarius salinarum TaxID=1981892 RepID=UPI000C347B4E|nr:SH3 domain-containing protein [Roseovarius salinarum]
MTLPKLAAAVVVALLATLWFAGSAAATEARATVALNVRAGPGTEYSVIDTLRAGEVVDMQDCRASGWCFVQHPGPDGWVSARYLTAAPGIPLPGDDCSFQLVIGPDGPRFSITCGDRRFPGPGRDRACFYDGPDYTGEHYCRGVGTQNVLGPRKNDRITSVRLFGDARVRLCADRHMGAFCRDLTTSEARLGPFLNNNVSSLRVYTGSLPEFRQACFYDGPGYSGEYFCRREGTVNVLPPRADDRITSVRLRGGARVRLCTDTYMRAFCRTLTADTWRLGPGLNNRASSLRVD